MNDAANGHLSSHGPGNPDPPGTPVAALLPQTIPGRKPRKRRSDSTWRRLTPAQIRLLETWLFEEPAGYREILARVQQHFGLRASRTSLCRYYQSRLPHRLRCESLHTHLPAADLNDLPAYPGALRQAVVKLTGQAALNLPAATPERLDQLLSVGKLLLASEKTDLQRARAEAIGGQFPASLPGAPRQTGAEPGAQFRNLLLFGRPNPAKPGETSPSPGFLSA